MCGRFTSTSTVEQLAEAYEVDEVAETVRADPLPDRYNVAPSLPVYAVAVRPPRHEGEAPVRQLGTFKWGLVPSWAKDPRVGNRMINARAEGIATKPAFRSALARRRCLIPADAFYEWQAQGPSGSGRAGSGKLPWVIRRRDGRPMALAGLWEVWRDGDGHRLRTCTIVTTEANAILAPIHERMPVVLPEGAWSTWLDPSIDDPAVVGRLLTPAPDGWFEAFPVSSRVSNVANEGPELIEPLPLPPG